MLAFLGSRSVLLRIFFITMQLDVKKLLNIYRYNKIQYRNHCLIQFLDLNISQPMCVFTNHSVPLALIVFWPVRLYRERDFCFLPQRNHVSYKSFISLKTTSINILQPLLVCHPYTQTPRRAHTKRERSSYLTIEKAECDWI